MRVPDDDVGRYLRMFTLLSLHEVDAVVSEHKVCLVAGQSQCRLKVFPKAQPEQRIAQRVLASEVVELVHGGECHAILESNIAN